MIQNEWNTGFTAAIRITNTQSVTINDWQLGWQYSDGSRRTGGWNAVVSGDNPYAAHGLSWNRNIAPGQTVEFGVQGEKGAANQSAQIPVLSSDICP